MQNEHETIKIAISGTDFNGFEIIVNRKWAISASHEEIISDIRREVISMTQLHRMWSLEAIAKSMKLHIHVPINNQTQIIYVCDCS